MEIPSKAISFSEPSDYKRLMNLKLFQKFLLEDSSKASDSQSFPFTKTVPEKKPTIEVSPPKVEHGIQTPLDVSIDSYRLCSEQSEIQGFSQHIYANSPDKQFSQYQYYPIYPQYPSETYKDFPKEDIEKLKNEYLSILNEKDLEINSLKKELENSKLDVMELEDKLKDISNADVQDLEKRISVLIQQNQKLLEVNRNITAEFKAKNGELESELRITLGRNEDLMKDFNREREKNEIIEARMNTIKERATIMENINLQSQDRILNLERELDAAYKEINNFKRRVPIERNDYYEMIPPNTARNEYFEISPKTSRNYNEEYPRSRNQETLDESFQYKRNNFNNIPNEGPNRLRNNQEKSPFQRQSLEQKLDSLLTDKQRLEKEYSKLPEVCKNISSKRRKEELELELEILDTNIHNLKSKIKANQGKPR